jgi:hypothetical protein
VESNVRRSLQRVPIFREERPGVDIPTGEYMLLIVTSRAEGEYEGTPVVLVSAEPLRELSGRMLTWGGYLN